MKGIYLAAFRARHPNYNIVYQDINPRCKCDLQGDMLEVELKDYDFIIATPPCNYWSRANYRRETSEYAQKNKASSSRNSQKVMLSKQTIHSGECYE